MICELAKRLGAEHQGFTLSSREIVEWTLQNSGWGSLERLERERWIDCQPPFEDAHYINGFGHPDGKFHFAPDWTQLGPAGFGASSTTPMPLLPDHHAVIEASNAEMPFRLITAPARHFLNSTFTETPTSKRREGRPSVLMHPQDAAHLGVTNESHVRLGNTRGEVELAVEVFEGLQPGVLVCESIWPNHAFKGGIGINAVTGADPAGPLGGAAFHDNRVWVRPVFATES